MVPIYIRMQYKTLLSYILQVNVVPDGLA